MVVGPPPAGSSSCRACRRSSRWCCYIFPDKRLMSNIKTFHLPDLGEGLPDATIVEWLVKEGDTVRLDAPLVSMETAKAVVEVPAPYSGKVTKLHGKNGDVIDTGAALIDVELDPDLPQRAEAEAT